MKITVYVVTTCIPERGETTPCIPSMFTTEAEAEAFLEEALKSEWRSNAPIDDETGDAAEYPGHWRDAVEKIAADNAEGTWGEWQLTSHQIEAGLPADTVQAIRGAMGAIASMDDQISQMEGMFDDSDGLIEQSREDGEEASEALEDVLDREAVPATGIEPEVFIEIDGGLVQSVYGIGLPIGTHYTTIDYDVEGADEDEISLVDDDQAYINGGKVEPWKKAIKYLDEAA